MQSSPGGGGCVDKVSLELASMVRPLRGVHTSPDEIWSKVVDEGAELPGNWNTTCAGARQAAEQGDWPLCAYLAAQCFCKEGAAALAEADPVSQEAVWLEVAAPIVVDVPRGRERLRVRFEEARQEEWISTDQLRDGPCGSSIVVKGRGRASVIRAETFKVGGVVQPVRFKRLQLESSELVELQSTLGSKKTSWPSFLDEPASLVHIPGVWFHVLAYPLSGNATKALLRPRADGWTPHQRDVLQKHAETLVSKCAKAGKWQLVETLLRAGVPCPDLTREFNLVCGPSEDISSAWRSDLQAASGSGRGRQSLLELVAWQTPARRQPVSQDEDEQSPLQALMAALHSSGQMVDISGGPGRPPLLLAAAEAERWDIVTELLQETEGVNVCTAALVKSRAFLEKAPARVRFLAEERARQDDMNEAMASTNTLKEYFRRHLSGQVVHTHVLPMGFESREGILEGRNGVRVLDCCLRLGQRQSKAASKSSGAELVFASITADELSQAADMARDQSIGMLPLDLSQRVCCRNDPDADEEPTCWVAVLSQSSHIKKDVQSNLLISVPANELTTPHILRSLPVRVTVVTPCCRHPLPEVPVYAAGQFASSTDSEGIASFRLRPGRYVITAPGNSLSEQEIEIKKDDYDGVDAELVSTGELFMFLQDMSLDDAAKDGVMLCGNRSKIPDDAGRFLGSVTLGSNEPGLRVCPDERCSESLRDIQVSLDDGRRWEPNTDLSWFEDFQDECQVSLLFTAMPLRLGNAVGTRPPQSDGNAGVPTQRTASSSSSSRTSRPGPSPYTDSIAGSGPDYWLRQIPKGSSASKPPMPSSASQQRRRRPTPDSSKASPARARRPSSASPFRGVYGARPPENKQRPSSSGPPPRPSSAWGSRPSSNPTSAQASPRISRAGSREQLSSDRYNKEPLPRPSSGERDPRLRPWNKPLRLSDL